MLSLSADTLKMINEYWASDLGCPVGALTADSILVVPDPEPERRNLLFFLMHRDACIISVPPSLVNSLGSRTRQWKNQESVLDEERLKMLLDIPVERIVGPAFIGYAEKATFKPVKHTRVRVLNEHDVDALEQLRLGCSTQDWQHGGSQFGEQPLVGRFLRNELIAVAGYETWGSHIAHISVVTHPAHRGKGYGRDVVSRVAEIALNRHLIPQYRTLYSNRSSVAIAQSLGFVPYASTVAVILQQDFE